MPGTDTAVTSLGHLLDQHAAARPDAVALCAPGRAPLTYQDLRAGVTRLGHELHELGIGRRHRVALVLPNGPELAVAFLAAAAHACAAPLNPAYRAREFAFFLTDLDADALVVDAGSDSPAIAVARANGIPVVELVADRAAPAGSFALRGDPRPLPPDRASRAEADDVALLLHTSGTTSRPKLVPLSHTNLCAAAGNTRRAFAIDDSDLCLNIMPLHHAHGLVSTLIAGLAGGAGMVCTPGFSAARFFEWLSEFRPTWYSGVPAMHQALLAVAADHRAALADHRLRVIRSASAPMPGPILAALEDTFGVPVIEAYGMTEAGSLITSNPLPPGERKPGSVGIPVGEQVAILDDAGHHLGPGESGEIAIRGANVTDGLALAGGWLRTGDQGRLDDDGYLYLIGRTKEIINRGGSKIAPAEIDEVLATHPAVKHAVAFGLPHPTLGEDVAVAIVPADGASLVEREIRLYAAERLADYKVPSRVFAVAELPRTASGKIRRLALADMVAAIPAAAPAAPAREPMQRRLASIWAHLLDREQIGPDDNFFDIGGNSLLLARLSQYLHAELGREVPVVTLTMYPTVRALAGFLTEGAPAPDRGPEPDRADRARQRMLRQRIRPPRGEH